MIDKIKKIVIWFWLNIEKFVLVVMIGILGYRVYVIAFPPPPPAEETYSPPRKEVPEELKSPLPPPIPPGSVPGTYSSLWRENPFWYYAGEPSVGKGEQVISEKDLGVTLLNIRQVGDRWRAQLRTRSTTKWYDEGEEFEQFILEQINPEEKTVVIYSEQYGRRFTLQMRR
ncbi:MAG: hypothetical protein N3G21_00070 [Candidatus Hydrogenedentes bacterium]|nr:hypothetical protein [Candidatus Hydrogenedentota bacterium]